MTTAQEADRLEAAMNTLRPKLSIDQEIAVWDTWQDHGLAAAQHVLSAIKEARSPTTLRLKASAPGRVVTFKATDSSPIDPLLEGIRVAYTAGDAKAFADGIEALIRMQQPQPPQQTAGPKTYRMTDETARAPIGTTKEISTRDLLDAQVVYRKRIGGEGQL